MRGPYAWELQEGPHHHCLEYGTEQSSLYRRRRLTPSGWRDEDTVLCIDYQAELANLVPRGRQIVVPGSGHFIQVDQPDAVIDAVCSVIEEVRGGAQCHD